MVQASSRVTHLHQRSPVHGTNSLVNGGMPKGYVPRWGGNLTLNEEDPGALPTPRARPTLCDRTDVTNDSNTSASDQPSGGHPFGMVQVDIFRDPSLPAHVKLVYAALTTYADGTTRGCWPSQATLATDTGLSIRSVGKALRQMEDAGLVDVTHTQTSNRYQLRDLKVGGYIVGSGPLGTTCRPDMHEVPTGPASGADKQDHTTRPLSQTSSTSGDAFAASGHRTCSTTDMKIMVGDDYWTMPAPRLMQYLTACVIATLQRANLELRPEGRALIGKALRNRIEAGTTYEKVLADVQYWVTHEAEWSQLAYPPESEAA